MNLFFVLNTKMENSVLLNNKVVSYSLIEEKENGKEADSVKELEKYLDICSYSEEKYINSIRCTIKIYKYGLFSKTYYFEIHAVTKTSSLWDDKHGRIFVQSFTNLNDLVKFSKNFTKDYIILVEEITYDRLFYYKYFNKYKIESMTKHNKKLEFEKKMCQKKKEIDELLF